MATAKPSTINSFHIALKSGEERDLRGAVALVEVSGALTIRNANGDTVVTYAAGEWTYCELERADDKG